jgi:alpha-D-ribose 1-methylphosphonate 5-triphosphate synthase subunit PhnH
MYDQFLEALGGQQKPLTPAEAAAELGLLEEQAQIWLDMAVRDGLARKASGRYRVVGQASLLPLIDIDRGR